MNRLALRKRSGGILGAGMACEEDECGPGPAVLLAAAFLGGAAPTIANYILSKLDPTAFETVEVEE